VLEPDDYTLLQRGTNRSPEWQMFGQFGKTAPQAGGVRDGQVANAGL